MQIIFEFQGSPEQYVASSVYKEVLPPDVCPSCGSVKSFESLGYYTRGLSRIRSPGVMPIPIRRFRCLECGISISLLPSFAQPYRLVRNEIVQLFFDGNRDADDVQRWDNLLQRYLRRFCKWFPELLVRTAVHPSLDGTVVAASAWELFKREWGPLSAATGRLVRQFRITAFGVYRCHMVPSG